MARYIDADALIEFITKGLNNPDKTKAFGYDSIEILTEIEYVPTADVAPKSEVEQLRKALDEYEETSGLKQVKAEVAREIFEDIESKLMVTIDPISFDGMARIWVDDFCELKKKYTEASNEVQHS